MIPVIMGLCFFFLQSRLSAQSCIPTGFNGATFNLVCPQTCSTLTVQIPHIKGTDNYTVSSIPHTPYPWVTAGGIELIELYADDLYSSIVSLPFPFCFYGSVYNSCVVGSNGLITFDVSNANTINAWSLTTVPRGVIPQQIPYSGGTPNDANSTYYPRAAIMGAYHDIFPLINAPQRKVEYSIVGTAPCRKFVVSFYVVPLYGSTICNGRLCTQQMVLHENTGIIDMHLGDKPVCNAWNQGLAILGLQNWNRNAAVTAPGKNCTVWNETGTSYRFTPSGTGTRFVRSELFTLAGTYLATADTITSVPGMLDIRFLNTCPPPDTTRFEVRTTFSSCNNPAVQMVNIDTITTIRDNSLDATASSTNNACGPPSGTITVTVPPGAGTPPFTYVLDGGAPIIAGSPYTFLGVLHGLHTVVVTDATLGCTSIINITVGRNNALIASTSSTQTYCAGSASGTITATVTNGAGPYTYTLNGGAVFYTGGTPHTFTGLSAGTHTLVVADATNCMTNIISINITDGPGVSGNSSATATTCPSVNNGTITVNATAGIPPFTYSLDGGPPQSGSNPYIFTNVAAGAHAVIITDNVGCSLLMNRTVPSGPAITASNTAFTTSCNGAADGWIRVTPLNGVTPFTYSLDATLPVPGPSPFTFFNLTSGPHTIQVFDAVGCVTVIYSVTVPAGPNLTSTATKSDVLCNGDATGSITVNQPANGVPPFQYSINGTTWQASRVFPGLTAGPYTVQFQSSDGCSGSLVITINQPTSLTSALTMVPVICNGQNNGVINVSAAGGIPPYQYSINGGSSWQSSASFNVSAGNYSIMVRDLNNCISTRNITMTEPAVLAAFSGNSNATCDGGNNGRITVIATGGNSNYLYALDGGSYQSSNIFNVAPGNYTVYVKDDLGCSTTFTTTVGLTFNLFLNPMTDPTICEGSSVQLQPVSNATIYNWSPATALNNPNIGNPTANPVVTTWYYLTVVLGRCTLWDTIRLNVNKAPLPDAGPDGDICYGQSYTLLGTGGTEYTWTPAIYLNTTSGANPVSTPTLSTIYTLS